MSNEEPTAGSGEEQGTDAGPIERTDASGETAEEQGTDDGAVDQTEPSIQYSATYGDEAEAPDIAVDSEEDAS